MNWFAPSTIGNAPIARAHDMAKQFIVGRNMPGYMPDSEPYDCDGYDQALLCLVGDMRTHFDDFEFLQPADEKAAEQELASNLDFWYSERFEKPGEISVRFLGLQFWLTEAA